jgi:hypothetical protein
MSALFNEAITGKKTRKAMGDVVGRQEDHAEADTIVGKVG